MASLCTGRGIPQTPKSTRLRSLSFCARSREASPSSCPHPPPRPRAWQPRTHSRLLISLRACVPDDGVPGSGTSGERGDTWNLPAHCFSWLKLVLPSTFPKMCLLCSVDFKFISAVAVRTVSEAAEMVEPSCHAARGSGADWVQLDLFSYNTVAFAGFDIHTCITLSLPGVNLSPLLRIRD